MDITFLRRFCRDFSDACT